MGEEKKQRTGISRGGSSAGGPGRARRGGDNDTHRDLGAFFSFFFILGNADEFRERGFDSKHNRPGAEQRYFFGEPGEAFITRAVRGHRARSSRRSSSYTVDRASLPGGHVSILQSSSVVDRCAQSVADRKRARASSSFFGCARGVLELEIWRKKKEKKSVRRKQKKKPRWYKEGYDRGAFAKKIDRCSLGALGREVFDIPTK